MTRLMYRIPLIVSEPFCESYGYNVDSIIAVNASVDAELRRFQNRIYTAAVPNGAPSRVIASRFTWLTAFRRLTDLSLALNMAVSEVDKGISMNSGGS